MDDLSAYERQRLENIQRNNAFLASLGFAHQHKQPTTNGTSAGASGSSIRNGNRSDVELKRKLKLKKGEPNKRRSLRIQNINASIDYTTGPAGDVASPMTAGSTDADSSVSISGKDDEGIDYDDFPIDPKQLDDNEFEVYIKLREWRLKLCRELDHEPYKIFQNRTLCESIRRRRNNPHWGMVDRRRIYWSAGALVRGRSKRMDTRGSCCMCCRLMTSC